MGFLLDAAIGTAVIAVPQARLPVLGLTVAVHAIKSVRGRKRGGSGGVQCGDVDSTKTAALTFNDIKCKIAPSAKQAKKGGATKVILDSISGQALPGRLLALMGPSGSGKTTLLNALASHVPVTARMTLEGCVRVNDRTLADSGMRVGYVQQEDLFYSCLTVRETLDMAATLRLPRTFSQRERDAAVDAVMQELNLLDVATTIVGDRKVRGVSGGERKRLAIACELLDRPPLLFLDEPTTGLDAFQALQVMQALKGLAKEGHTVVASIHQPRGAIFDLFDDLLLLSEGKLVYGGEASAAIAHFEKQGIKYPLHCNPAEYLADIISKDKSTEQAASKSHARLDMLTAAAPEMDRGLVKHCNMKLARPCPALSQGPTLWLQLTALFKRSWRQVTRDKATMRIRLGSNVQSALVFGMIWWKLRRLQISVPSRFGLLQVVAVYLFQTATFKTINLFPSEKTLVNIERAKGSYKTAPYFLSKVLSELPFLALYPSVFSSVVYPMTGLNATMKKFGLFLASNIMETWSATAFGMTIGAAAPSTEAALVLGPMCSIVLVVFGGLYTNQEDIPRVLRWIPHASAIKAGYDTLCKNEFTGLEFEADEAADLKDGADILRRQGFSGTAASSMGHQAKVLLCKYWLAFCILRSQKPRFQPMLEPSSSVGTRRVQ